jgi:hypothetical protein
MNNDTITETDRVLADMLTENTGSHMLDSGGVYGRNWERHKNRDVQSFIDAPAVNVTEYGIDLDLFHYLRERIEFMPDIQAEFDDWAELPENEKSNWYTLMEEWCEKHDDNNWRPSGFNSYNGDCLLSQTIQADYFTWKGKVYLMLQIHGGCDVRGGYTAPKIFREYGEPGIISYDWNSYTIQSDDDRKGERVCLDFRDGDVINEGGECIGYGYRYNKKDDDDPLLDWFGDLEWDDETNSFIAPDGDGHVKFIEPAFCW